MNREGFTGRDRKRFELQQKTRTRSRPLDTARQRGRCKTTGKTRYLTEPDSWGAALRLSSLTGVPVRTYPCTACGSWHLSRLRPGGKA